MPQDDYRANLRSPLTQRGYDKHLDRMVRDGHRKVLDWGCGHGQNAAGLIARGLDVSAFDYRPRDREPGMLKDDAGGLRRLELFPEVEAYIERHDPVAMPYDDDTFDAVLSMGVLEHVGDPDGSLEEIKRVLQPGGTVYVYKLPNKFSYTERLGKRAGYYWHGQLPDDRLYTMGTALDLLGRHGFEVLDARMANMLPLNRTGAKLPWLTGPLWTANRALEKVPGLNLVSTNVELVARSPE